MATCRPQTLFEDYPGCPRLGPPPVQSLGQPGVLASLGVRDRSLARALMSGALAVSGFPRFCRSGALERSLAVDTGTRPLPGPTFSAAVPLLDDPSTTDPFDRGGRLLQALWETHADIRAGRFEPDRHGERLLESRGYLNLFGTRFEHVGGLFRVGKTPRTDTLLVCGRGRQHLVEGADPGTGAGVAALREVLHRAWTDGTAAPAGPAVGRLSGAGQVTQRQGFARLLEDAGNRASYAALMSCFAVLCLDLDTRPDTHEAVARAALIGNPRDRWYHASLQIVVFGNGTACLVCNPDAGLTGNVMMRAAQELHRRARAPAAPGAGTASPRLRRLGWNVGRLDGPRIDADLAAVTDDQPATFDIDAFGRQRLGALGLPPVELFVAGVQRVATRLRGRPVSISQFVGSTAFGCGSHATAVVSTTELARFLEAIDTAPDGAAARACLPAAVESQRRVCRTARSGIPLPVALSLFRGCGGALRRRWTGTVLDTLLWLLRRLDLDAGGLGRDVALSHPAVTPGVPLLGRPGVRLPYLTCFGLHYQVLEEGTRLTVMPGRDWRVSNRELVAALGATLEELVVQLSARPAPPAQGIP